MRLNEIAIAVVVERMTLFKIGNMCQPGRKILLETTREVEEILETIACIRYVRPGDQFHFPDLTRVNVDVCNVLRVRCKLYRITGNAIIETRPDSDQKVAIFDSIIGVRRTMHAEHVERQWMCGIKRSYSLQGRHDRNIQCRCKPAKFA